MSAFDYSDTTPEQESEKEYHFNGNFTLNGHLIFAIMIVAISLIAQYVFA